MTEVSTATPTAASAESLTYAIAAPDAPTYITIKQAADALASRSWPVVELVEAGELRAVRFGVIA